ncbi:MAG: restriction endonuclease subunit S, partial [Selenomonadaceae bacterium]|nr:restriction endonuclease subunit S [Selenomonadaceae bacterium]
MNKAIHRPLGEVAEIIMGQSPESESYNDKGDGIPFYQGKSDFGQVFPTARMYCNSPKKTAITNDILLSVRAPIGDVNIAQEPCCIGRGLAAIRPKEAMHLKYLFYLMDYYKERLARQGTGSTFKAVGKDVLNEFLVPVWDVKIQEIVATKLDDIQRLIFNRQQALSVFDTLIKSRFIEMFGDLAFNHMNWTGMPLVETCANNDDIKCGPFGTQLGKHEYLREGVPLWGIPQINAAFAIPPTDFLSAEKAEQLSSYSLLPGDIAMSRKGNVGKCAIYPEGSPKGIIHSDVLRIRVDTEICNPVFLMCQLHFSRAIGTQIDTVSSGAIMAGINVTKLKKILVYVPPIDLQNQFADFVA